MTTKRPPRRRQPDRLVAPDEHETPGSIPCTMVLAPLDRLREAMDRKWGHDRLVGLYPPEPGAHVPADKRDAYRAVPERYGLAVERLHAALDANDPAEVRTWTERATKLIGVMDRECERAGVTRPEPETLETESDGRRVIVVSDTRDAALVEARNPGARVLTLRQCAVAAEMVNADMIARLGNHPLVAAALDAFPGAEVSVGKPKREDVDGEIPF